MINRKEIGDRVIISSGDKKGEVGIIQTRYLRKMNVHAVKLDNGVFRDIDQIINYDFFHEIIKDSPKVGHLVEWAPSLSEGKPWKVEAINYDYGDIPRSRVVLHQLHNEKYRDWVMLWQLKKHPLMDSPLFRALESIND